MRNILGYALVSLGIIVLSFGAVMLVDSMALPTLFAGSYIIFSLALIISSIPIFYIAYRSTKQK